MPMVPPVPSSPIAETVISATSEARSSQARDPAPCPRRGRARRRVLGWAASLRSRRRLRGTGRVFMRPPGRLVRRVEDDCRASLHRRTGPYPSVARAAELISAARRGGFRGGILIPSRFYLSPRAAAPWSARLEIGLANRP